MQIKITPGRLHGEVTPPPGKSMLHRHILCAALADGESVIHNAALSDDIRATLGCVEKLGASWRLDGEALTVQGMGGRASFDTVPEFDCFESGSTLRFLLPVALAVCGGGVFYGRGRLMQRPLGPYFAVFEQNDIQYKLSGDTLTVSGRLKSGEYRLPGNVSSQFFSGLMLALPLVGNAEIIAEGTVESADYIEMTREARSLAGVSDDGKHISRAGYKPFAMTAEADWSQAAFWYEAVFLGHDVAVRGLDTSSCQGDRRIAEITEKLRQPGNVSLDVSQCPDLVPPVAAMAAFRQGDTDIVNAARLRLKESDRLSSVTDALQSMGAWVTQTGDGLHIEGRSTLPGGFVDSRGDHRIAMMAAVAAAGCTGTTAIDGAECVSKSYPDFWQEYRRLGGIADVCNMG